MVARWMQAKVVKQKRMRRAWARPLSVKSGIQPNRDVISQYQRTAKGLGKEEAQTRFPNVAPGKRDIQDRIEEILEQFDDPLFITVIDNAVQRCRIFFNSRKDCCVVQHVSWKTGEVRLSITYRSIERAHTCWVQSKVTWKVHKRLPAPVPA